MSLVFLFDRTVCSGCGGEVRYRCSTCNDEFCETCVVAPHASYPLHRIERWNGTNFVDVPGRELGLRLRLAHGAHGHCPHPVLEEGVPVRTIGGIVHVDIEFCGCNDAPTRSLQLMSVALIPVEINGNAGAVELRLMIMEEDLREERREQRRARWIARLQQ
ncbi:hypothetical protein C8R46DRAFT_1221676 [Mycena filopes]|nr:hypothetical protein C8R46DRAFT_1221676 [Mycena filopes]